MLTDALVRYSETIRSEVGKYADSQTLFSRFCSNVDDVLSLLDHVPDIVYGIGMVQANPVVQFSAFALFSMKRASKFRKRDRDASLELSQIQPGGFKLPNDFSIERAQDEATQ